MIQTPLTVFDKVAETARRHPAQALFALPERVQALWGAKRAEWRYDDVVAEALALSERYRAAGYGAGHRVAVLLENRPAHFLHWLALNRLGVSLVPINPDYTADETRYLLEHSESALAVAAPERLAQMAPVAEALGVPCIAEGAAPPPARRPAPGGAIDAAREAALLYTSGTTGRPKGCILSNDYFYGWGEWYVAQGGAIALRRGEERLLQPLPTFHTNAMGNSFMGMVFAGGTQVILDRFHPRSWWDEAAETRATCFHFLGVMPAMLLNLPPGPQDRAHGLRFGMGGGLFPAHHAAFEARFGVKLLEGWAMTETGGGGLVVAATEPRHIGTRCIGRTDRPGPPMEARLVDDEGRDAAEGEPGEFLVRAAGPDPKRRFFSGYLKDPAATRAIWAGGWLHTGDVVRRDAEGHLYFLDRKKNIVRRSGENIAAIEVETILAQHPAVAQVAVLAALDEIRGEEVLAVVAPKPGHAASRETAEALFRHVERRLAYYKAPGWVAFVESLPTTSTQKVRKGELLALARDPGADPRAIDLRALKRQAKPARAAGGRA
jgi:acyl-CoA synthetase (AMP-forming)/AMP-acid ligase II